MNPEKTEVKLILSIEDDPASIEYMKTVGEILGHQLVNFESPLKAIDFLRKNRVDLVLMDLRLPEMNGLEATRIIKSEFPRLPLIVQTAFAMKDDRASAYEAGCDAYLAKPVPLKELKKIIQQYLGKKD